MERSILLYNLEDSEKRVIETILKKTQYTTINMIEGEEGETKGVDKEIFGTFENAAENSDMVIVGYNKRKTEGKQFLENIAFLEENGIPHIKSNLAIKYIDTVRNSKKSKKLNSCPIPVILVFGMGQETQVYSVELYLYQQFIKNNYSILHVASEKYFKLIGGETLPEFLLDDISIIKKQKKLKKWILDKVDEKKYDAVLVGLPESAFDVISNSSEELFEMLSIFSSEIQFDYIVLCGYNTMHNSDAMQHIYNVLRYRYSIEVDALCVSNMKPMIFDEMGDMIEYLKIDKINELADNQYFIPEIEKSTLFENIITTLSEEVEGI